MPNTPVLVAATGLPALRPPLQTVMLRAHDLACEMPDRLPYAARFRVSLLRSWREAKATVIRRLRAIVEARVERLIAFLDAIDGDCDLEPSLGYYDPRQGHAVDAELDPADAEPSLGSLDRAADQTRWAECNVWNGDLDLELDRSDYEDDGDWTRRLFGYGALAGEMRA